MVSKLLLGNSLKVLRNYCREMSKSALVLLAPGTEEMEFTISVDVLRRAGVNVTVAGVVGKEATKCSRQVLILPDISLSDAVKKDCYDAVVLPGGLGGSQAFCKSPEVGCLLKEQESSGRIVAAICAGPTALKTHGIGLGKKLTAYPSFKDDLSSDYEYISKKVVVDGNLITSQGPATAFDFAFAVVEKLVGEEKVSTVKKELLYV